MNIKINSRRSPRVALKAALEFVDKKGFSTVQETVVGASEKVYHLPKTNRHGCDIYGNGSVYVTCKPRETQYTLEIR